MTAPSVPPSTIIAAVTWVTSETLPPSITNPPMMPPTATSQSENAGNVRARLIVVWVCLSAFFSAIGPRLSHAIGCRIRHRSQIGWAG